jgi:glutathione S-transferase
MVSTARVVKDVSVALVKGVSDPMIPFTRRLAILGGFTASGLRLAAGTVVGKLGPRPEKRLVLWDFERCPYCRLVREAISTLDLDVEVRPCPRGGTRFRPELQGGGVPRLLDPNTGETIVGSRIIVAHLYQRYGVSKPPVLLGLPPVVVTTGLAARVLTGGRGFKAQPSRAPEKPLELWAFESSPYSRLARARLSELELPYVLHTVAKGSPKRRDFVALSGKMQVPYLVDPNTGVTMFESLAIEQYLEATYGVPTT